MATPPSFFTTIYNVGNGRSAPMPPNYIEHQTVVNNYTQTTNTNPNTSSYQYIANASPNDIESLLRSHGLSTIFRPGNNQEEEKESFPSSNANINNNEDIPPNTEKGRIAFADKLKLKLEEMVNSNMDWKDPNLASILALAFNAYNSPDYYAQYAAWMLITNYQQEKQGKQSKTTNILQNILDPDGKFIIFTKAHFSHILQPQSNIAMDLEAQIKDIYDLNTIHMKSRQELIDDKFFEDSFFESAKYIFCNQNNTFLVGINNAVDEFRTILMEKGEHIKSVFSRSQQAIATLNATFDDKTDIVLDGMIRICLANDSVCGITSIRRLCLKYLGFRMVTNTGICKVAVRIKVPLVSHNKSLFSDILKRNNLFIGGNIFDQCFGLKGGIYEVSVNAQCDKDLIDLMNGCKQIIRHETALQQEQRAKIAPRYRHLSQRCTNLSGKSKDEILDIILQVINNGKETQIDKRTLDIWYPLSGYAVVINMEATVVFDIGFDEDDKPVTLMSNIANIEKTRQLAIKAIQTLKPLGEYKEFGAGYKKRFRYIMGDEQIDFALNHKTVTSRKPKVDNIELLISRINNSISSNELEIKEFFNLLNDELFSLFAKNWNNCQDYIGKFNEYETYFEKLMQWDDDNNISLKTTCLQLSQYKNDAYAFEDKKKIFWLHLLSTWCRLFMKKMGDTGKSNILRIKRNNQWSMEELSWLFEFLLECFNLNNNEYYSLFASPTSMIIDYILMYFICIQSDKYIYLFQKHLNYNMCQILLSGIIKFKYLQDKVTLHCATIIPSMNMQQFAPQRQMRMPLMQIQNVNQTAQSTHQTTSGSVSRYSPNFN